jgi:hypothetical protein
LCDNKEIKKYTPTRENNLFQKPFSCGFAAFPSASQNVVTISSEMFRHSLRVKLSAFTALKSQMTSIKCYNAVKQLQSSANYQKNFTKIAQTPFIIDLIVL